MNVCLCKTLCVYVCVCACVLVCARACVLCVIIVTSGSITSSLIWSMVTDGDAIILSNREVVSVRFYSQLCIHVFIPKPCYQIKILCSSQTVSHSTVLLVSIKLTAPVISFVHRMLPISIQSYQYCTFCNTWLLFFCRKPLCFCWICLKTIDVLFLYSFVKPCIVCIQTSLLYLMLFFYFIYFLFWILV
jgi:hypothetical protein